MVYLILIITLSILVIKHKKKIWYTNSRRMI
jgi:hypothetical protein